MAKKIVLLFPGQGAQKIGMGKELAEAYPVAREVFDEVDDALGEKLSDLIFSGSEEELRRTANTQPALLATSIATWRVIDTNSAATPELAVGHSLGEFSALVASGALALADAARTVRRRGELMQAAEVPGGGGMSAVMGMDASHIDDVLAKISNDAAHYVSVANYNGPGQTVIAGTVSGIEKATEALKEAGARRIIRLSVSAPFHCALMSSVVEPLRNALEEVTFSDMRFPIIHNVTAEKKADSESLTQLLLDQVTAPVRFTESASKLLDTSVDAFVEVGPGMTLIGIMKRMDRSRVFLHTDGVEPLRKMLEACA